MPTLIMRAKLEKSWEHWVAAYDAHKTAREEVGMKDIYRGHSADDTTTIHVVAWTPSMQVLEEFMQANANVIKDAGHIPESTKITVCSD